nr:MAG TPA: hypothetical protein [Caudoviricetes sp.]
MTNTTRAHTPVTTMHIETCVTCVTENLPTRQNTR